MAVSLETRTRGDFVVLHLMQHLAAKKTELPAAFDKEFVFAGEEFVKVFSVDEQPVGPGYLTMQILDFKPSKHQISINDKPLPIWDLAEPKLEKTWFTWTEVIPEEFLVEGKNTFTIKGIGDKVDFLVRDVILHWHEAAM